MHLETPLAVMTRFVFGGTFLNESAMVPALSVHLREQLIVANEAELPAAKRWSALDLGIPVGFARMRPFQTRVGRTETRRLRPATRSRTKARPRKY